MARESANQKKRAHELIERLAPDQTSAVVVLLEAILDPVARAIANAPIDDEPITPEEEAALNQSRDWLKKHSPIPHEQVMAELGITEEELNRFLKQM